MFKQYIAYERERGKSFTLSLREREETIWRKQEKAIFTAMASKFKWQFVKRHRRFPNRWCTPTD